MDPMRRWFGPCDPAPDSYVMMWSCPARYEVWWEPGSKTKPRYVLFSLTAEDDRVASLMHLPSTDPARWLAIAKENPRPVSPRTDHFSHTACNRAWLSGLPGH
jgi:hypothetical protein